MTKPKNSTTGAPRLDECKDVHKRLGIDRAAAKALIARFPALKLTPRTERAMSAARELGEKLDAVNDAELLNCLLTDIAAGRFGAPDAQTLIGEFGDILSTVTAGARTGMKNGEHLRLSLAVMLCLNRGAIGIKINDRKAAAYYLGKVYKYGLDPAPTAVYLDPAQRTLATEPYAENIAARAAALGAKYVIVSQHDDGALFDVRSTATKLKAELAEKNVILLDWLVFDDEGYASFDVGSALANSEPRFTYFEEQ